MGRRIVIIGAGYSGVLAAVRLARQTRAADAEVVLVSADPWFVDRIRLHQEAAGMPVARRWLGEILQGTRVVLRVGTVDHVELAARRLELAGGACEAFDDLVLATGSAAHRPDLPGIEHATSCSSFDDVIALRERLDPRGRAVVVGGGLTGVELASELAERHRGLRVVLVAPELVPSLSPGGRAHVARVLAKLGVTVQASRMVACERDGVVLEDGEVVGADVIAWSGGFSASPLARAIGLEVANDGRALVDAELRSRSHPFVRVVGDAARTVVLGRSGEEQVLRMGCATAGPQGAFAADAIASELADRQRAPFSFGYFVQCVSLGRRDGIIQRVDPWDRATSSFIGRRTGAFVKEAVCRFAVSASRLERHGISYRWPRSPAPRSLPLLQRTT